MPKLVGTRERVHQPFYDSLIRTDGSIDLRTANQGNQGALSNRAVLFQRQSADLALTNLPGAGQFPSDQTFVTLAIRVWTYFRFNPERAYKTSPLAGPVVGMVEAPLGGIPGVTADRIQRVHKLYHQAENQIFWQYTAGDKPQITTFTAYTPMAGGLDGFFADSRLPRANNGLPTSGALMRLARPILVPPRQGFQVVATLSPAGQAVGASFVEQVNGLVPNDGPSGTISANPASAPGFGPNNPGTIFGATGTTGLSIPGIDDIEKDVKYLIDGIHSRDVL